jgi:hypothetical protein
MKVRFSLFVLIVAVAIGSVVSGCQYNKAKETLNSKVITSQSVSSKSMVEGYYANLSVIRQSVSADKLYDSSDSTISSKSSRKASSKNSSKRTLSNNQLGLS